MNNLTLKSERNTNEDMMIDYTVGAVHLNVSDLDTMLAFYEHNIGLQVHDRTAKTASLGVGEDDLLVLTETPDLVANRSVTGLYHFAILVPDRPQLARSLRRIAETQTPLQGLSDHIVSEAIYLADPDGNGIEIYRDRSRETWYKDGEFQLATVRMDVDGVIGSLTGQDATWNGLPQGTVMGHIHLHVADVPQTEAFYQTVLGMDIMASIGSATFMSYDGYHHHVGGNIWGGRQIRTGQELGLEKYELHTPDSKRLDDILASAEVQGIEIAEIDGNYTLYDPSHNKIVLRTN